jgi:hypothetical protein
VKEKTYTHLPVFVLDSGCGNAEAGASNAWY